MGAAISLLTAPDHPEVKVLWVESPYTNLISLVEKRLHESSCLPAFLNPRILLMGTVLYGIDFSTVKPAKALAKLGDRSLYQVHSAQGDDWVPLDQAEEMEKVGAHDTNVASWIAPGKGHVAAYTNNKQEYTKQMLQFYEKYLK